MGAVAVHPVDDQFFQVLVEGAGEIVAGVGGSGLLEVRVGDGIVTDLLPEELVGGGEVGTEPVIEQLNYLGKRNGRVFVAAGADFGRGGEATADSGLQQDAALADLLQAVVLEVDILIEVEGVAGIRTAQFFVQEA